MSTWSELKDTRKTLLGISQLAILLIVIAAVGQWLATNRVREQQQKVHSAELALRQAETQLEAYKLGDQTGLFALSNLSSMSPLPNTPGFIKSATILASAQAHIEGLMQSEKIWKDLAAKSENAYTILQDEGKNKILETKGNVEFAQEILMAAQAIHDWLKAPSADPDVRAMEIEYLDRKVKEADSLIDANKINPATLVMRKNWDAWMAAMQEQLLEEKAFFEQKISANNKLIGYAISLEEEALRITHLTSTSSMIYLALFLGLALVILFLLRALSANPHLNTMFTPKGVPALQSELEELSEQVDQILAVVDRAWLDSRTELKEVRTALKDSDVLDSEVRALKTQVGSLISNTTKTLQEIETNLRTESATAPYADQVSSLLALVQSEGSTLAQALEALGESGVSIQHELKKIRSSIKKLVDETQKLKKDSEALEDSSLALKSAVE